MPKSQRLRMIYAILLRDVPKKALHRIHLRLVAAALQELIREERHGRADEQQCVDADAHPGGVGAGLCGSGGRRRGLGYRIAGLGCSMVSLGVSGGGKSGVPALRAGYLSLQRPHQQPVEDLARLVAVADILESLGGVLAADVEEDFLPAPAMAVASA